MFNDVSAFEPIISSVEQSIIDLKCKNSKILVAVSGGADSIALFYSLLYCKEKYLLDLSVVHVNHGLRDEHSDNDAKFVNDLCIKMKVPCHIENIKNLSKLSGSLENNARIARYNAFNKIIKETKSDFLFLAHHSQDQVETILMNIFRGCGIDGLQGMKQTSMFFGIKLVRPLLNITKDQVLNALSSNNIEFRTDNSNFSDEYNRNYLRLNIIPKIQEIYPKFTDAVLRLSEVSSVESDFINNIVENILSNYAIIDDKYCIIFANAFNNLDKAIAFRLIRRMYSIARSKFLDEGYLSEDERSISYKTTLQIYDMITNKTLGKIELNGGIFISLSYKYIHFFTNDKFIPNIKSINISEYYEEFSFNNVDLMRVAKSNYSNGKTIQAIPNHLIKDAVIRYRNSKDKIRPYGSHGSQSLKKYLINKKIDLEFRDHIPLVAVDNEVLWVMGVGASELCRVDPSDNNYSIYKIKTFLPWTRKE